MAEKQSFGKLLAIQVLSIILSALLAALITVIQSYLASTPIPPIQNANPTEAAAFGAFFKTAHSLIQMRHYIL
jgi:hypothetical protein